MSEVVQPASWPRPRGYAHGRLGAGRLLAIAGQIGSEPGMTLPSGFLAQFARAIDNVLEVVQTAGGAPTDLLSLTLYVTDLRQYRAATAELGAAWRARFGTHYPAMALVEVKGLLDPKALVEIQGLAVLP